MADLFAPDDLVALKAAWYAARERVHQLSTVEPAGEGTVPRPSPPKRPGEPDPEPSPPFRLLSEEQSIALNSARAEEVELALRLSRHPWKRAQPNVHAAENALNEAAFALWSRQAREATGSA
jgi:hypothetical protein